MKCVLERNDFSTATKETCRKRPSHSVQLKHESRVLSRNFLWNQMIPQQEYSIQIDFIEGQIAYSENTPIKFKKH